MGENGTFGVGHAGEYVDRRMARAAFVVAALGGTLWFGARMAPGLAFGPWQGRLLADNPLYPAPLVTLWFCKIAQMLPVGNPAWKINLVSVFFGALACGSLAAITTAALRPLSSWGTALGGGLFAAVLFALLPEALFECTAAGPAPVSTGLTLAAAALILLRDESRPNSLRMAASGVTIGCAAANHPSIGLVAAMLLLGVVLGREPVRGIVLTGRMAAFCLGFILTASIPLTHALTSGETLAQFLAHALHSPYPMAAEAAPHWEFFQDLNRSTPLALLILCAPGVFLLLRTGAWGTLLLLSSIILCMGPLLPSLTHQSDPGALCDGATPRLLVCAGLCALAGAGLSPLGAIIARGRLANGIAAFFLLLAIAAALAYSWPEAPERRHRFAEELGDQLLRACPDRALVVSGDANLEALLLGAQVIRESGAPLTLIPLCALTDLPARRRMNEMAGSFAPLDISFPDHGASERWKQQLPFYWQAMAGAGDTPAGESFADFALWDFVMDNPGHWPVFFAGITAPWLMSRAQPAGALLRYPGDALKPDENAVDALLNTAYPHDPGLNATLFALLLSQSENARQQGRLASAERFAAAALRHDPRPEAAASLLRARAYGGSRDLPFEQTESGQSRWLEFEPKTLRDAFESGLNHYTDLQKLNRFLAEQNVQDSTAEEREAVFGPFWASDDLFDIVRGYDTLLFANPSDMDALYQAAAAQAQLGHFTAANLYIEHWAQTTGHTPEMVARKLTADGRFAPLLIYRKYEFEKAAKNTGSQGENLVQEQPKN